MSIARWPNASSHCARRPARRRSSASRSNGSVSAAPATGARTGSVCSRNAHCAVCCSRYSMRGSRPSSTGPYRTPAPAASSGWPCAPRYSLQIASIRCHFGAVAPRIFPASSSALSTTGRASGDTGTEMRSHASSCSGSAPVAVLTAAFRARTVSPLRARATHEASSSPRATGSTVSACRAVTSPVQTASRKSGRPRSSRASRAIFCAVLAAMPSRSRA